MKPIEEAFPKGSLVALRDSWAPSARDPRKPKTVATVCGYSLNRTCVRVRWAGYSANSFETYYRGFLIPLAEGGTE